MTISIMMSLPFQYGFVNDRWCKAIKPWVRKIHQLHIIGLLEADFNTALKLIFSWKMMRNAETSINNEEQWGGHPNCTALDTTCKKILTLEYPRTTYKTIAMFANDATVCFDRIVPGLSSRIARKFEVSTSIMECRNETIKALEWNIRTGCGDSDETYKEGEDSDSLCGEVQGKGDVASLWCLTSHTILTAHTSLHSPMKMHGQWVIW